MRPGQPLKFVGDEYGKLAIMRELEWLHKRINDLIVNPAQDDLATAVKISTVSPGGYTKESYVPGDVGSAADIAAALNVIAISVNTLNLAIQHLNTSVLVHQAEIEAVPVPLNAILGKLNTD